MLQAVLDEHVSDVLRTILIQPGETDSAMVFFGVMNCFPRQCGMLHTVRHYWKKPLQDETVKYLFEHVYDVAMDARREKKILLSQFDDAIGLKFATFFKSPFLSIRTIMACRQELGMLACCQTLQHTVYSRCCSKGHLFQTRYGILFGPGAELFLVFHRFDWKRYLGLLLLGREHWFRFRNVLVKGMWPAERASSV